VRAHFRGEMHSYSDEPESQSGSVTSTPSHNPSMNRSD
jgi:hypothetical protein